MTPIRHVLFRTDFKLVTRIRLREAKKLLSAREFGGAFHLAGIAVECAIKACIAKQTRRFEFPDKNHAARCYSHDLSDLMKLAGLTILFEKDCDADPRLRANWAVVKDWTVDSRYEHNIAGQLAKGMYSAVASRKHGVLKWLRSHW
jgi:hypothetical protein